ncbi:MAG TPA: hypothetical protein VEL05_12780 [Candidatus Acidoferrum sp.]|nr:hypothetical protein [Candidatus Acidoferrum sp.]
MNVFVRAVVTGFGFSLGAALFRKVSNRLGLNDEKSNKTERAESKVDPGGVVAGRSEGGNDGGARVDQSILGLG